MIEKLGTLAVDIGIIAGQRDEVRKERDAARAELAEANLRHSRVHRRVLDVTEAMDEADVMTGPGMGEFADAIREALKTP